MEWIILYIIATIAISFIWFIVGAVILLILDMLFEINPDYYWNILYDMNIKLHKRLIAASIMGPFTILTTLWNNWKKKNELKGEKYNVMNIIDRWFKS